MSSEKLIFAKWFNRTSVLILALGSGLIALSSISVEHYNYSGVGIPPLQTLFQSLGAVLIVLAIIMILARWFHWVTVFFFTRIAENIPVLSSPRIIVKQASRADLSGIQEIGEQLIDGGVSSLAQKLAWRSVNPAIFFAVKQKISDKPAVLTGYFCVIPIKAHTVNLLLQGRLTAQEFEIQHIFRGRFPSYIYIGGLAANGRLSRAAVVGALLQHIGTLEQRGLKQVFTKPTTREGLNLAKRYNFKPISGGSPELNTLHSQFAKEIFS